MDSASRRPGSRYWLITRGPTRQGSRPPEMFTLDLQRGKVLAVFASEASAEWVLYHVPGAACPSEAGPSEAGPSEAGPSGVPSAGVPGIGVPSAVDGEKNANGATAEGGWRPRAVSAGELISLLSGSAFSAGPCTGVERVIVDPSPVTFESAGRDGELVGESRGCFLESLMGRGRAWFEGASRAESV